MQFAVIFCIVSIAIAVSARPEEEKYTTKFDNIDLDAIIKSDRLLRSYVDCLLGGKCTKEGETLKQLLPDALATKCSKCSETQKNGAKKVISYLLKNKRDWWNELEPVYDPNGTYRKAYEKELKEQEQSQ